MHVGYTMATSVSIHLIDMCKRAVITLIQVAENVIHTEAQLNIRSSDDDTSDFGNFDIKLLTASFELDNITDEEKQRLSKKANLNAHRVNVKQTMD